MVKPNDTSKINISPNKDYVTLLTCYPYGINTERLLVRGERVFQKDYNFNKAENLVNDNNSRYINKELIFIVGVLTLFLILIIIVILRRKIKN
nr:sortase [Clostridium perfringens]